MRTAINFDDKLLVRAQLMSHLTERAQLLREALLALAQCESACRRARLGGTESHLQSLPLRREASE